MRARVITAALSAAALLVAGGCSDGSDPGEDEPTRGSSVSSSPSASGSPSQSPSEVAAAAGPRAELEHTLSLHVLEGDAWHVAPGGRSIVASARLDRGFFDVGGTEFDAEDDQTLDEAAAFELQEEKALSDFSHFRHTGNREVAGAEVWEVEAKRKGYRLYMVIGFHNGYSFRLRFEWPVEFTDAEAWIDQILASVEWK